MMFETIYTVSFHVVAHVYRAPVSSRDKSQGTQSQEKREQSDKSSELVRTLTASLNESRATEVKIERKPLLQQKPLDAEQLTGMAGSSKEVEQRRSCLALRSSWAFYIRNSVCRYKIDLVL